MTEKEFDKARKVALLWEGTKQLREGLDVVPDRIELLKHIHAIERIAQDMWVELVYQKGESDD